MRGKSPKSICYQLGTIEETWINETTRRCELGVINEIAIRRPDQSLCQQRRFETTSQSMKVHPIPRHSHQKTFDAAASADKSDRE
jgi:hypothetical protein